MRVDEDYDGPRLSPSDYAMQSATRPNQEVVDAMRAANVAKARRALAGLDQAVLDAIAEAAISILDEMVDPDEDQCQAGDDGCGPVWIAGVGMFWGSDNNQTTPVKPDYDVDQRLIIRKRPAGFDAYFINVDEYPYYL